jgi:hypothetical protein
VKKKPKRIPVPASVAHVFAIIERKELAKKEAAALAQAQQQQRATCKN